LVATNKSLALTNKSLDRIRATKGRRPACGGGTPPPADAQVIAGTILGIAGMVIRGKHW